MDNENQQPEGIWVNRAEYNRLKQAETERLYPTPRPIASEPFANGQVEAVEVVAKNTNTEKVKLVVVGVLAILSFIYPAFLVIFIITGLAVIITQDKQSSGSTASQIVKVLLIVAAVPFVGIAALFAFFMFLAGSGKSA